MSGSTEIPEYISKLANAVETDKLWPTAEQAELERRKEEQEAQEAHQDYSEESADKARYQEQRQPNHDTDIHGVPKPRSPTEDVHHGTRGYERPMPTSLKNNAAKINRDSEPTQSHKPGPIQDDSAVPEPKEAQKLQQQDEKQENQEEPSDWKALFSSFLNRRRASDIPAPEPFTASPEQMTERPHPQSSVSQQIIPRPTLPRRQHTVAGSPTAEREREAESGNKAKSRWAAAAHGLIFPLRRRRMSSIRESTRDTGIVTTLIAGAPAANLLASHMLIDDHHHRIPVIVDLLTV